MSHPSWDDVLKAAWSAAQESWYVSDRAQAKARLSERVPHVDEEIAKQAFAEVDRLRDIAVEVADDFREKRIRTQKDALRVLAERCPNFTEIVRGDALQFGLMVTR